MNFHGIDLNLLAAFDALVSERSVTRAAARVGVSQPAMSSALSRLRTLFGDPLFVRGAHGLLPTPKARDLAEPVSRALQQIEAALLPKARFEPAGATLTFTLGLAEYPAFVLLPKLAKALAEDSAGIALAVHLIGPRDSAIDLLDTGTIDAAVNVPPSRSENRILTRAIMRDRFVTVVRRQHPAVRQGMDLAVFLKLQHLLVSPEGNRHGFVDEALAYIGERRTLSLTLPHMFAAPAVVAQTDLVATLLSQVVQLSPALQQLAQFPPPIALPEIVHDLMWHRRNDVHPAQQWLRDKIAILAAAL